VANGAKFNGTDLLKASGTLTIQVGSNTTSNDVIEIKTFNATVASGGLLSGVTASVTGGFTTAGTITVVGATGGSGTSGSAVNNAHRVINTVDKMLENVDKARSELGVVQNRLTSTVNNL